MKMYYITLNHQDEAQMISHELLEKQLVVCTNWFPMTCAYRLKGKIKQEPEVVLILKTKEGLRDAIEKVISQYIDYTNYIAELDVHSINTGFLNWLKDEVP